MKPKINSTKQLLFLAVAVVLIFEVTAVYAEEFVNNYKFPSQWEHRPEPVKTKDGGNVPPGLAPYNPDPYNFHPTGNQSDPGVIIDKGKFKIWYSAYIEPNGQGMQGIAYTTSEDGILWEDPKDRETWVKLVVKPWGQGGWDCLALETPNVCVHPNTGKYYMYTSDRYEGQKFYIGLATSDDGVNWVRYSEPVLKPKYDWEQSSSGVLEPSVIYDEKEQIFKMWYASFGTLNGRWQGYVGYATSKDGIHWERLGRFKLLMQQFTKYLIRC